LEGSLRNISETKNKGRAEREVRLYNKPLGDVDAEKRDQRVVTKGEIERKTEAQTISEQRSS